MNAVKLTLADNEKQLLITMRESTNSPERLALRAGIVLHSAAGLTNDEVAAKFQVSVHTVSKWRRRYHEGGLKGLSDWPRSGKPRRLQHETIAAQMKEVLGTQPPEGNQWSVRRVAKTLGLAPATTGRIWRELQGRHCCSAGAET